jgi:branched-chain amino acid transport system substrate-binding protein
MNKHGQDEMGTSAVQRLVKRRHFLTGIAGAGLMITGVGSLGLGRPAFAAENAFAPWFGPGGKAAGSDLTWVHGVNVPLTGQGADVGKVMSEGAQLAAEVITASGGPQMTVELNDHQSGLVPPAVQGIRRLIAQKGINSVVSCYGAATEALFPLVEQYGLTLFWTGGPSPAGLNKPNVWLTIAIWALDPTPGGIAYMAKRFPDAKRLAIVGSTENGVPAINELAPKAWAETAGGEVVSKELVNTGATDFSSSVSRIKASKADVIFTTFYGNDQGFFIKQVREAGISAPILCIDLTPAVAKIAGSTVADNCFLATDGYLPENPNPYNQAFVKVHRDKYGRDPEYFAANFFESTMILWLAIQRAIKADGTAGRGTGLSKAIENDPQFPSVYGGTSTQAGSMTFNKDHSVTKPMGVFMIGPGGSLTKLATISKNSTVLQPI